MGSQTVRVGSHDIAVDQSPLRTTFIRSHNRFELIRPSAECLVIKNHWGIRLFAWILCALGLPVLLLALMGVVGSFMKPEAGSPIGVGLLLLWGGVMFFMGVWLLGQHCRFDSASGRLTLHHFWRWRCVPLADIVAVQVIDAGQFQSGYSEGVGGGPARIFSSYQLNLVLRKPHQQRLFLVYDYDMTDMVRKAVILADFLQVPLLASPVFQETVKAYSKHDVGQRPGEPAVGRFRGSEALRPMRDKQLPAPYDAWIDRTQPLPSSVQLLPRSVAIVYDLGMFLILGMLFLTVPALMIMMFWNSLIRGDWGTIIPVAVISSLLASVPLLLLRRSIITVGAYLDLKRGRLRQGILLGHEGLLVRMEPNACYLIPRDRFVKAKTESSGDASGTSSFIIETLDGQVGFFTERLNATPEQLNRCIREK